MATRTLTFVVTPMGETEAGDCPTCLRTLVRFHYAVSCATHPARVPGLHHFDYCPVHGPITCATGGAPSGDIECGY